MADAIVETIEAQTPPIRMRERTRIEIVSTDSLDVYARDEINQRIAEIEATGGRVKYVKVTPMMVGHVGYALRYVATIIYRPAAEEGTRARFDICPRCKGGSRGANSLSVDAERGLCYCFRCGYPVKTDGDHDAVATT